MIEDWVNHYTGTTARYLAEGNVPLARNELANMTCQSIQTDELRVIMDVIKLQMDVLSGLDKATIGVVLEPLRRAAILAGPNNSARAAMFLSERGRVARM